MIYLDNNATTRPSPNVVKAVLQYLDECYFNPSSSTTAFTGADAPRRQAASTMARMLNAEDANCFAFTSGATESNNWVFSATERTHKSGTIVISAIEHPSVSEPALRLAEQGFRLSVIPVDPQGRIYLESLSRQLDKDALLVSVMAANNETGVVQPVSEIGHIVRQKCPHALFHTDGSQTIGKLAVDVQSAWSHVDLISFSSHKWHGPKGIGGLYIRPGIELPPLLLGGGQERGLRSGTTNTAGLAGLAAAAKEWDLESACRVAAFRDRFEHELRVRFPAVEVHSSDSARLPNTSCFSIPDTVAEEIATALAAQGILIGVGSACSSGALHPPKTLLAMNVEHEIARAAVRVSLSTATSWGELAKVLDVLVSVVGELLI